MLSYPIMLEQDDDTVLATSPDFPELTTFGSDRDDALAHAVSALEEAIAARIHWNEDIPAPSGGGARVTLPALTAAQVERYRNMRNQAVTTTRRNTDNRSSVTKEERCT